MKIVLASKSPRRKVILERHGYDVLVDASNADESLVKEKDIRKRVLAVSKMKAEVVAKRHPNAIIVAADTSVYFNGEDIGQQHTEADAEKTIRRLLGKTHEVYTGITVINTANGKMVHDVDVSKVTLKKVSDDVLKAYLASGQYKGKAGAYNIEDPEFESFVGKVDGCRYNIMGLPIKKVEKIIRISEGLNKNED